MALRAASTAVNIAASMPGSSPNPTLRPWSRRPRASTPSSGGGGGGDHGHVHPRDAAGSRCFERLVGDNRPRRRLDFTVGAPRLHTSSPRTAPNGAAPPRTDTAGTAHRRGATTKKKNHTRRFRRPLPPASSRVASDSLGGAGRGKCQPGRARPLSRGRGRRAGTARPRRPPRRPTLIATAAGPRPTPAARPRRRWCR
jgi:hypothetical protein